MGVSFARHAGRGSPPTLSDKWALYGYRGEIVTADRTFTTDDLGKTVFSGTGTTSKLTYTLPAPTTIGGFMNFICQHVAGIVVAAATADTLITFNDTAADSLELSTANASIGGYIHVVSDGTYWNGFVTSGTRTVNT